MYKVALLATGIDTSHRDFVIDSSVSAFKDFTPVGEEDPDSTPTDQSGQGTHCASIITRLCPGIVGLYVAKITNTHRIDAGIHKCAEKVSQKSAYLPRYET